MIWNDLMKVSGHIAGAFASVRLPGLLAEWTVTGFAAAYGIDTSEAEKPIAEYRTISDLFTRRLKVGVRPLGEGVVHPVDGELTQSGKLLTTESGPRLIQTKGVEFALGDLLGDPTRAHHYEGGSYFTYYLSPQDYHRVHQVWSGELDQSRHIPGYFWPVNSWGVSSVPGLFVRNERKVFEFTSKEGRFAVVMVAALNVGGIEPLFREEVGQRLERGEELGVFRLGSSVVVVLDAQFDIPTRLAAPRAVRVRASALTT